MNLTDFVVRHADGIRRLLARMTGNSHVAEDLYQNVLMKCWVYYRQKSVLPPFMFAKRVALNEFYTWRRKRTPEFRPDGFEELTITDDPTRKIDEEERSAALRNALATLPPLDRDLTRLHYVEGWPLAKIAKDTGLGVGAVKSRLHRARSRLRAELQRDALPP